MSIEFYSNCVFVLILLSGIHTVYSVKCYSCLASQNYADCAKPNLHQISLVKCDMEALRQTRENAIRIEKSYYKLFDVDNIETEPGRIGMACLKMITKVGNKDYFLRGCQLAEQEPLDICTKVKEKNDYNIKTIYCDKCTSEGCNGGVKFVINVNLIAIITLIVYILF